MSDIIHDPTRGWLLLTEKWPEKTNFTYQDGFFDEVEYQIAEKNCLSTAIEIDPKDWVEVITKAADRALDSEMEQVNSVPKRFKLKSHHPYSVDAEFEVVDRLFAHTGLPTRQIARLVKAKVGTDEERNMVNLTHVIVDEDKEDECDITVRPVYQSTHKIVAIKAKPMEDFKKFTLLNPTDSVTSDGTPVKPTESQDELWLECYNECYIFDPYDPVGCDFNIEKAKARFRIERI